MSVSPLRSWPLVTVCAAVSCLAASGAAQREGFGRGRQGRPSESSKNHGSVTTAFRAVVAAARRSTVVVECEDRQVAFGTVVGADGYILSKTSELRPGAIRCRLSDGRTLPATRLGDDYDNDLVLLKVGAEDLVPVAWSDAGVGAGSWVAVPGPGEAPVAIGVVSAAVHHRERSRFRNRRPNTNRAYLGVTSNRESEEVRLDEVRSGTGAAAAGLKVGDVVLEFGARKVTSFDQLVATIGRHKVGDKVRIKVRRGTEELTVEAELGANPELPTAGRPAGDDRRGPISNQERYWGPLSDVRIGFKEVIQHDSVVRPNQCGGPLVNLDGEVVGVNISRPGRIETLALTARVVRELLPKLKAPKK